MTHESALFISEEVDVRVTRGRWGMVFWQIICRRLGGGPSSNAVFVYGLGMKERRVSTGDGSIFGGSLVARVKRHIAREPDVIRPFLVATPRGRERGGE